ncbi:MAG TPA: DinB family protein [Bryobacteraceae bacterium]|nr:DinB family protein [Bryobacteraceae bacterium]
MSAKLANLLKALIERESPLLRALPETEATAPASRPGAWTRKEELGHLLDSATNNRARFVRAATQPEHRDDGYDQNAWVRAHRYDSHGWLDLVAFWEVYNRFLVKLVEGIPDDKLSTPCIIKSGPPVTLGFVIEDYVLHMQHHIDHILDREVVTSYPGAAAGS